MSKDYYDYDSELLDAYGITINQYSNLNYDMQRLLIQAYLNEMKQQGKIMNEEKNKKVKKLIKFKK